MMKFISVVFLYVSVILSIFHYPTFAQEMNGFNLRGSAISVSQIHKGGPPRDGIPALTNPHFETAGEASFWLDDDDRVLAISRNGIAKAYPIRILNWHEIVNDEFDNESIVVTYCPLCGTGVSFKAEVGGARRTFGVSGLLYNSDVLLYDRQSESLWSQIMQEAVSGAMKGEKLEAIVQEHTTWGDWKERYPMTQVLSKATGYQRDYDRNPYQGYERSKMTFFPVSQTDNSYHSKEWVVGLEVNGKYKAYPFSELKKSGKIPIVDTFEGKTVRVHFDKKNTTAWITDAEGEKIPSIMAYWFAWYAFHPKTARFSTKKR